jgi:hypothetical protein
VSLNGEIFYSIKELRVLADRWRIHYNTIRPALKTRTSSANRTKFLSTQ